MGYHRLLRFEPERFGEAVFFDVLVLLSGHNHSEAHVLVGVMLHITLDLQTGPNARHNITVGHQCNALARRAMEGARRTHVLSVPRPARHELRNSLYSCVVRPTGSSLICKADHKQSVHSEAAGCALPALVRWWRYQIRAVFVGAGGEARAARPQHRIGLHFGGATKAAVPRRQGRGWGQAAQLSPQTVDEVDRIERRHVSAEACANTFAAVHQNHWYHRQKELRLNRCAVVIAVLQQTVVLWSGGATHFE
jgi:hypothetical protein